MYDCTDSDNPLIVRNVNYKADIRYATSVGSCILTPIGIWPTVFEGVGRFLPAVVVALGNLTIYFAVVPCVLYIIYDEKSTLIKLKLIGLMSFCISASMKYCALALQRSSILQCIKHVEADWKSVESRLDREAMLKYGRVGRNVTILCASFMYSGGFMFHTIMPFLSNPVGGQFDDYNRTIRLLVYSSYTGFFESQKSPVYELVFTAHFLCGYVIYTVTAGGCCLAALFATHTCGQIEIVMSRLKDLVDGDIFRESSNVNVRLKNIVQRHLRILGFVDMAETALQEVFLIEFVCSTSLICLLEYCSILEWQQSNTLELTIYGLLLISFTYNIFILCYIGQLLMDKTSYIGESCFMVDWYRLPIKTTRELILIIAMSANPVKITAGRMADLSISTFGIVLQTSLTYLSFLRTAVLK